jgi:hypothetical protein
VKPLGGPTVKSETGCGSASGAWRSGIHPPPYLQNRVGLSPDSVFGCSQITIAQTAKALAARGVAVEVIGIPEGGAEALPLPLCDAGTGAAIPG